MKQSMLKKLDANMEKWLLFLLLAGMTLVLGIQVFYRFVLNNSLTWSEELARFMFIWSAFLSIGFCLKEGISLKIDTVITLFPKQLHSGRRCWTSTVDCSTDLYKQCFTCSANDILFSMSETE